MSVNDSGATMDVVVAGGGIAGLALALALRRAAPFARAAVVDPAFARTDDGGRKNLRAVAVAAGSRQFLESLGVWDAVAADAQPIREMVITDSRAEDAPRPAFLGFAEPVGGDGEPFAHMVFQDDLRRALVSRCRDAGLALLPARVTGFRREGACLALDAGAEPLRGRLLVAADGGRSRLREAARIGVVAWDYDQAAVVATIAHERSHEGRATQHFLPAGPLAILPLRAVDGTPRRFSIVWTERRAEAERLAALAPPAFLAALERAIGFEFGALALEDVPSAHRLRLVLPRRLVGERFALLGDAARTIHPLAGQGLNLGLRDASVLADTLAGQVRLGLDPGDAALLQGYERARRFDAAVMAAVTDALNRLFSNDTLPLRLLRDLGLGMVDRMPALKRALIRDAAGLAGAPPRGFREPGATR